MHVTMFDRIFVGVELVIAVVVGLGFLIPYLLRRSWRRSPWGWHMVAVTAVLTGEAAAFLAILLGAAVPIWLFELGFGLVDAVGVQRLWLFLHSRRADDDAPETPTGG